MRKRGVTWFVLVAGVALAVEIIATLGWWRWLGVVEKVAIEPEQGAAIIADSGWSVLPSTVWWYRYLDVADLASAGRELIIPALETIGERQTRWFVSDPNGFKNLARAALLDNDIERGLADLRQALARDPMSPYLRRLMALVLRQSGYLDEFLEHLAVAEGLAPGFRRPPVDLIPEDELWIRKEGLRRRIELYPRQRVNSLITLAKELRSNDDISGALLTLAEVEHHPEVILELARWDFEEARYQACVARCRELAERTTLTIRLRGSAWSLMAQAADHAGNGELAVTAAEQALRLDPRSPAPYLALASIAERRGDLDGALDHLRRAWGIAPTNISILVRLARVAERTGHQADAKLALERTVEVDPDSPGNAARLVDYYLRNGDFMAAAMRLSRSLERFPTDSRLLGQAERLSREVSR